MKLTGTNDHTVLLNCLSFLILTPLTAKLLLSPTYEENFNFSHNNKRFICCAVH